MPTPAAGERRLVIAGHGMVAHKLLEIVLGAGGSEDASARPPHWQITVFAEETRAAYDRVNLSAIFAGKTPEDLSLADPGFLERHQVSLHLGEAVTDIERSDQVVTTSSGRRVGYDDLVLATGSAPFVPPLDGADLEGTFVYRSIDDVADIARHAAGRRGGVVVGGGLLGLEAAHALHRLGLSTRVLEYADRLMPAQLDRAGASLLENLVRRLGIEVRTSTQVTAIEAGPGGGVAAVRLLGGDRLATDMVVFAAGVRPRDELARRAGLTTGPRGGVAVDAGCRTEDAHVYAIGDCAHVHGRTYGLVAPGYEMARVVADRLVGGGSVLAPPDCSTKLKTLGVDVGSFGDALGAAPDSRSISIANEPAGTYKSLVLDPSGRVAGGILVGDASDYELLALMARGDMPTPERPEALLGLGGAADGAGLDPASLPDSARVCSCQAVTKGTICSAIAGGRLSDVGAVKAATGAGTGCGGCVPIVTAVLRDELGRAGITWSNRLCEHFAHSRQELFDLMRVDRIMTFAELITRHGSGRGCDVCKPAVASMLASLGTGHILDGEAASLQDTNDHFLANLQKDGTYSVVPRVPAGEITPDQLIALGAVAKEFGLYTKITGAQRVDLFGATVDQLPAIWARLIGAGFESGHAYGKALRTVKSCVGSTWCRYGVQDSTSLAIALELRYRGLRAPHKIKGAVSGCARECAEAQSKDFGVIATERGWNLYVAGNGGMRPQHGVLLVEDVDSETLIRYLDRYLMFYVRTADRLERTATWLNQLEGGVGYLRRVVVDDVLGICAELEAEMARHVAGYECEWKATLDDPNRLRLFRTFVNSDAADPDVVFVPERRQHRPARPSEREALVGSPA